MDRLKKCDVVFVVDVENGIEVSERSRLNFVAVLACDIKEDAIALRPIRLSDKLTGSEDELRIVEGLIWVMDNEHQQFPGAIFLTVGAVRRPQSFSVRCVLANTVGKLVGEVTRCPMRRANLTQGRRHLRADSLRQPTPRPKWAARGGIERAGHVAAKNNALALASFLSSGNRREQRLRIGHARISVEILGACNFDKLAKIHDADAIADILDDRQIMRNEQVSQPELLLKIQQKVQYLRLNGNVQSRDRLVRDDELWPKGQRTRNSDPLPLTAAELVRVAIEIFSSQTDDIDKALDAFIPFIPAFGALDHKSFRYNLADVHARIETSVRVLKDDLHVRSQRLEF